MRIDTSGLSCPEPVLKTKIACKASPASLEVVVDNTTARQNVTRFLNSQGYTVKAEGFVLQASK